MEIDNGRNCRETERCQVMLGYTQIFFLANERVESENVQKKSMTDSSSLIRLEVQFFRVMLFGIIVGSLVRKMWEYWRQMVTSSVNRH